MLAGLGVMDNPNVDPAVHGVFESPGDLVIEELIDGDMQRLTRPISLQLSARPTDLHYLHSAGKTALWRRPGTEMIQGAPSEADKTRVTTPTFPLAGDAIDPEGRYIPRAFSIDAGNAAGHALVMYPTPLGTRFGRGGGLLGTLRFTDASIAPWALLTLLVSIPGGGTQTFRGQADHRGDFMLPMHRLPPLPEGIDQYAAQLSIAALLSADPAIPLDTADLVAMDLEDLQSSNSFSSPIGLDVVPGEIRLIRSASKDHLAVQPS